MIMANWPKMISVMPPTNTMGTKMAMVVSVEATTATPTSFVPWMALSRSRWPFCRWRWILSTTTTAASTTSPTATARAARLVVLIV